MKTQQSLRAVLLLCAMFASLSLSAQNKVKASDVMDALKNGEDVNYENVIITGVLDFTFMDEKLDDLPRKSRWWRDASNEVKEDIESRISFKNVIFEDDVLAYYHDRRSGYTFTADFEQSVTFENCEFGRNAMFKYSTFEKGASFSRSKFTDENTFKYAEFEGMADFSKTYFDDDAMFKYTEFKEGATFNAAQFDRSVDMKYTKVNGDFDIEDMDVRWDIITKYAEVNGRSFTRYLMNN